MLGNRERLWFLYPLASLARDTKLKEAVRPGRSTTRPPQSKRLRYAQRAWPDGFTLATQTSATAYPSLRKALAKKLATSCHFMSANSVVTPLAPALQFIVYPPYATDEGEPYHADCDKHHFIVVTMPPHKGWCIKGQCDAMLDWYPMQRYLSYWSALPVQYLLTLFKYFGMLYAT
jgi:hypothetical protein